MSMRLFLTLAYLVALAGCGTNTAPNVPPPSTAAPAVPSTTSSPAVAANDATPVATLLGKPVLSRDCLSASNGIGSVEVGLHSLVLGVLMNDFFDPHSLTLTQTEIDAFWERMRAVAGQGGKTVPPTPPFDEPKAQAKLDDVRSKLAAPNLPWLERLTLEGQERGSLYALEHKSVPATLAYSELLPLRCKAALYKKYGGRVVAMQISMEPAEAFQKLIQDAESSGKLTIHDLQLKQAFWKRINDTLQHQAVAPELVDFSLPAWLQMRVGASGSVPPPVTSAPAASHPATPGSDTMLQHFVGAWSTVATNKPVKGQPEQMPFRVREVTSLTLKNRFLIGREMSEPDGVKRLWLMTYDARRNVYPFWMFDSNGLMGGEWGLTWDDATSTATGGATDTPAGWTSRGTNHFPDADTNLVTAWMRDEAGTTLFDSEARKTREPVATGEATLAAWSQRDPEKPKASVEQIVLERLIGEWDSTTVSKPAEWTPQEVRTTSMLKREWILDGQFVLETSRHSDGQEGMSLFAYDAPSKSYRSWWFNSEGNHNKTQGTWDEATQTLKYQAEQEAGRRLQTSIHFVDADRHDWQVKVTDADGKLYVHLDGTVIRQQK